MIRGACLCGELRYEAEGERRILHCHCSICKKHHGAPFATFVEADDVHWLAGEASLLSIRTSAARVRRACGRCGSVAPAAHGGRTLVPAGNLLSDLPDGLVATAQHIFTSSQAPWFTIGDELPRHEQAPPAWVGPEATLEPRVAAGAVPGSCLCGEVAFAVRGAPARWYQCHCSRCRRARSAVHGSNMFHSASQFDWQRGRDLVRSYKPADAERFTVSFCVRCGGGAPVERPNVPFVLVPAALFDRDPGARPQAHIFVASKASWYRFEDGLPRFDELPPA